MRIAVVANNLRVAGGASVGRNVLETLPAVAPMHEFLFVIPRGSGYEVDRRTDGITVVESDAHSVMELANDTLRGIPRLVAKFAPDLVWSLGNLPLRHPPCRQALLVHDPHLFYPQRAYADELVRYKLRIKVTASYLRRSLRFVDHVFCQTRTAADHFRARYDYPNVSVMPNAVSGLITLPQPDSASPVLLDRYRDQFKLFALTKYYAHKNLETIVDAYRAYGADLLRGTVCFLTVDSSHHPRAGALLERVAREAANQVINLGPVPQALLGGCFINMNALLHPTLLESFSASYIEAMAFGLPILTSDLDFARDICGAAAEYFDPLNPAGLAESVHRVATDAGLRRHLTTEGKKQLASLTTDWHGVIRSALDDLRVSHL
jgi:glycosyltransferase involved in cell wall biosynthesis